MTLDKKPLFALLREAAVEPMWVFRDDRGAFAMSTATMLRREHPDDPAMLALARALHLVADANAASLDAFPLAPGSAERDALYGRANDLWAQACAQCAHAISGRGGPERVPDLFLVAHRRAQFGR
jgi:hypothetical protein